MKFHCKRAFDLVFATAGLLFLSPLFAMLAVAVRLSDGAPIFYRQQRVGQGGRLFAILKFRSMVVTADKLGLSVTRDGDSRITRIGRFLRKSKLDELPQLWNVLCGEMSFVGPRPEVPRYVAHYTEEQRQVLKLKPGITDLATLEFRNEEELLRTAEDTEKFYLERCVPRKIELNLAYAAQAGIWQDVKIILRTVIPLKSADCILKQRQPCSREQTAKFRFGEFSPQGGTDMGLSQSNPPPALSANLRRPDDRQTY